MGKMTLALKMSKGWIRFVFAGSRGSGQKPKYHTVRDRVPTNIYGTTGAQRAEKGDDKKTRTTHIIPLDDHIQITTIPRP